jgi:hypothetical protein
MLRVTVLVDPSVSSMTRACESPLWRVLLDHQLILCRSPAQLEKDFNTTVVKTLGLPYAFDLTCGKPSGAAPVANTRSGSKRVDAYAGYLAGKNRPNLTSQPSYS